MPAPLKKINLKISDWESLPDDDKSYFIDGEIYSMSPTGWDHGAVQANLASTIKSIIRKIKDNGNGEGNDWLIVTEASVKYLNGRFGFVHDLAGWKKDRWVNPVIKHAIDIIPDWVCEILSPSNSSKDFVDVKQAIMLAKVPHYWIVDIQRKCLIVYSIENNYTIAETYFTNSDENPIIAPFLGPIDLTDIFSL